MLKHVTHAVLIVCSVLALAACSDGSDKVPGDLEPRVLTLLVTNDDGIGAPGIDALVNTLLTLEDVDVQVVAPAENQSGSSDKTTEGELVWQDSATSSGYPSVAVFGFPADSVRVAVNELGIVPDLVVSGVNSGQNVGPLAPLSGTVGAARWAAREEGYPAVASSAGLGANADFDAAAQLVVDFIEANRTAIADGSLTLDTITSFNVPGCTAGDIRGFLELPLADAIPPGENIFMTDCSIEPDSDPTSDVDAMLKGFASQTDVPLSF